MVQWPWSQQGSYGERTCVAGRSALWQMKGWSVDEFWFGKKWRQITSFYEAWNVHSTNMSKKKEKEKEKKAGAEDQKGRHVYGQCGRSVCQDYDRQRNLLTVYKYWNSRKWKWSRTTFLGSVNNLWQKLSKEWGPDGKKKKKSDSQRVKFNLEPVPGCCCTVWWLNHIICFTA